MINMNKKYKTRLGSYVEFFKQYGDRVYGLIIGSDGLPIASSDWDMTDGKAFRDGRESDIDLIEVPFIDLSKKYRTKAGQDVELFKIHKDAVYGIVFDEDKDAYCAEWDAIDGKICFNPDLSIFTDRNGLDLTEAEKV